MSSVNDKLSTDLIFSFQLDICIPVRMDHKYKNNPDRFCYICGNVVFPNHQAKIPDFVKKAYQDYFGAKLGDQDKPFTYHVCCKTCVENFRERRNVKEKYAICHSNDLEGKKKITLWTAISAW